MPRFNMCESCWLQRHPPSYGITLAFRGVADICSYCGKPNRDGIYVREDKQPDNKKGGSNEPPLTAA